MLNRTIRKRTSVFKYAGGSALAVSLLIGAAPARATGIEVVVIIVLKSQAIRLANLLREQLFNDNRSAVAVACTDSGCDQDTGTGNWFTSAEAEAFSQSGNRPGTAYAHAINSLGNKTVQPTGGADQFSANAQIAWKGQVKKEYRAEGPEPALWLAASDLPDPVDVDHATYTATWATAFTGFGYSFGRNGSGSAGINIAINGATVFSGGVASGNGNDNATFSGDMASYAGQFSVGGTGVNAAQLDLGGSLVGEVDYASFYADPSLVFDVDGSAFAGAAGAVPEPQTWMMLIVGFGIILGASLRNSRRRQTASGWVREITNGRFVEAKPEG